ncbi:YciY family protein, partial [Escherichia coli]
MKRSRTEVGRWRMQRQASRRKSRWLEGQSRRNMRIHSIRTVSYTHLRAHETR